mmetsp:Transcript_8299/g.14971  ORF Transcript_8299/g.14971 Transcript_8299/m.14971 type:complete len:95 (+) Transcript_8299:670-954(+)
MLVLKLVSFLGDCRSSDASYAWRKMDGFYMDGREWKVDYAIPDDFKFFGWKWTEGGDFRDSRSRSRSPTPVKKDKKSYKATPRSNSPTNTNHSD